MLPSLFAALAARRPHHRPPRSPSRSDRRTVLAGADADRPVPELRPGAHQHHGRAGHPGGGGDVGARSFGEARAAEGDQQRRRAAQHRRPRRARAEARPAGAGDESVRADRARRRRPPLVFDLKYYFKERIEHGTVTVDRPAGHPGARSSFRCGAGSWSGTGTTSTRTTGASTSSRRWLGSSASSPTSSASPTTSSASTRTGSDHRGDPALNESWFAFGTPVHAVAAGTVVAAVDAWPDARKLDVQRLKTDRMAMFGNHVVVRHADGAFALYAHLRQGSVRVQDRRARCRPGQTLGAVGASGGAAAPHLHFELQTTADADGEGCPRPSPATGGSSATAVQSGDRGRDRQRGHRRGGAARALTF